MRLLTPALGVWVAEGCRELNRGGLGCLGAGLNVGEEPWPTRYHLWAHPVLLPTPQ